MSRWDQLLRLILSWLPELVAMGITTTMAPKADWEKVPIDEKIPKLLRTIVQV